MPTLLLLSASTPENYKKDKKDRSIYLPNCPAGTTTGPLNAPIANVFLHVSSFQLFGQGGFLNRWVRTRVCVISWCSLAMETGGGEAVSVELDVTHGDGNSTHQVK